MPIDDEENDDEEVMTGKQIFQLGYITGIQASLELIDKGGDPKDILEGLKNFINKHEKSFKGSGEFLTLLPLEVHQEVQEIISKQKAPDE